MTKSFLAIPLLLTLCLSGCSDSPSRENPIPVSTPASSIAETPQVDKSPTPDNTDGSTNSQSSQGSSEESTGGQESSSKSRFEDPKYDAKRNPQTEMTLESGVKREFQNVASAKENEKYRKRAEARRAAKLKAREKWKGSGVDAPLESVRIKEE